MNSSVKLQIAFELVVMFAQLNDWCDEAGGEIEIEFLYRDDNSTNTVTHLDENNKYWVEFRKALTDDL